MPPNNQPGTIDVVSPKFLGHPLTIRAVPPAGKTISKWDYIALYRPEKWSNDKRLEYQWLPPSTQSNNASSLTFNLNVDSVSEIENTSSDGATKCAREVTLVAKLYANGGYVKKGDLLHELKIVLQNPLLSMQVAQNEMDLNSIKVSANLAVPLPQARVSIACDGVRVDGNSFPPEHYATIDLWRPRVPGHYTVAFNSSVGTPPLGLGTIEVPSDASNHCTMTLSSSSNGNNGVDTRALVVTPRSIVNVKINSSCLQTTDEIFIQRCDSVAEAGSRKPSAKNFQLPNRRFPIQQDASAVVQLWEEGVYYVCVAMKHQQGTFLCAAHSIVVVSTLAVDSTAPPSMMQQSQVPQTPVAPPPQDQHFSAAAVEERFLCVICKDALLEVKLDPCGHLCLCTGCQNMMQQSRQLDACPICRASVQGVERVFLP